jgi:hypothetical protein
MKSIWTRLVLVALCLSLWVSAASVAQADNGTQLGIAASVGSYTCSGDNKSADTHIDVTVTSTGSAAPADVLVSTDGGATFTQQVTISDWSHSGRNKSAELTLSETLLANTATQFKVCVTQPGSNGDPDKSACANKSITPSCVAACVPDGGPCEPINPGACCSRFCREFPTPTICVSGT